MHFMMLLKDGFKKCIVLTNCRTSTSRILQNTLNYYIYINIFFIYFFLDILYALKI